MEKQYKLIALMGKAGSGKDTIMKKMLETYPGLHEIVSCTTRPRRDYEVEGINYYFYSVEEFTKKVINGEMLEATEFNGWFYGTPIEGLSKNFVNIGVFNPAGIEAISGNPDIDMKLFYITARDKTRLLRQLNREGDPDVDEIIRRYDTDKKDFIMVDDDFDPWHILNDDGRTPLMCCDSIYDCCGSWLPFDKRD